MPLDWSEEELNTFFDTMINHYNCYSCFYEDNLRYWSRSALEDVKIQCNINYSEIPWQYLLRNPLLKKEKYLAKIGKNAYSRNWERFYRIDTFLDLSDKEIKIILNNIDETKLRPDDEIGKFVLRNIKHIKNKKLLDKVYSLFHDSIDFDYGKKILEMPYPYVLRWITDHDSIDFLKRNRKYLTNEKYKELLLKALETI